MNTSKILLFHVASKKEKQIDQICNSLHIKTVKIKPTSYSQKLGYLAGISGFNRENISYSSPDFPSEMMIFSGMDSDLLDSFLALYKEKAIEPIGLKAVLTPHNIFWTAEALYKELLREHQSFSSN